MDCYDKLNEKSSRVKLSLVIRCPVFSMKFQNTFFHSALLQRENEFGLCCRVSATKYTTLTQSFHCKPFLLRCVQNRSQLVFSHCTISKHD